MASMIPSWSWSAGRAIAVGAFLWLGPAHAGNETQPVLVELFTSQGCTSCPPADAFMAELQKNPGVVALSFNIDYWDYIGWRDTLANHNNTLRQQAYSKVLPSHQVYTPQMVVDGREDVAGNQKRDAMALIERRTGETAGRRVGITLTPIGDEIDVRIGAGPAGPATIWMAHTLSSRTVNITSGENHGRTVTYSNVVRSFAAVSKWSGEAISLRLPAKGQPNELSDGMAVWVQSGEMGAVLGAAQIKFAGGAR